MCWLIFLGPVAADTGGNTKLLGDVDSGSRAAAVHLIPVLDEEGQKILPDDEPLMPFSTRRTCGTCHNVDKIAAGWHFNAVDANIAPGRPGQPWIFVDAATATQIPLSYRTWRGVYSPQQLGITPWKFVQLFGRQLPGGGPGELESDKPDETIRGFVSGKLEINCLACHDADPAHDQAEYAAQIARQNFRWAATAGCGFASVAGSAKQMPDTYDPLMPEVLDDPALVPPAVTYRTNTFDHKKRVFFNIAREVPDSRCYFCHSTQRLDREAAEKWQTDEDVHLAAGLTCVDCHRNGLDHNIIRGYQGEDSVSTNPLAAGSSCRGCHLPAREDGERPAGEDSSKPVAGRLGAPIPRHPGIPVVHFEKLTCTACHSGPWPGQGAVQIKTSLAHGLGTHNVNTTDEALPHIFSPVFAKGADGKIGPHNLIWPAFWASLKQGKVTPVALDIIRPIAAKVITADSLSTSGDWPGLTDHKIAQVLRLLPSQEGKPVYISGGRLYFLDDRGQVKAVGYGAAQPYLWPIAHDVRGAAQSLGAAGCGDCHATDSPFFFGGVTIDSPLARRRAYFKPMFLFQRLDPVYTRIFAMSFVFRPWLKVIALASSAVMAGVLLFYALRALRLILKVLAEED